MRDVRAALTDPATTVDLLVPKAISRLLDGQGATTEATMAILRVVGRAHRTPNDAERLDAIAVTKLFQAALPTLDLRAPFLALTNAGEADADAVACVLRPSLMNWRAAALGVDAGLGQSIEDGLLGLMVAIERAGLPPFRPRNRKRRGSCATWRRWGHPGEARQMPVMHWISPAFLAILPVGYTGVEMLAHLAENPGLQEQLRARPDLRPGYLREVERLMNSFRYLTRQVGPAGLDLGDCRLRRAVRWFWTLSRPTAIRRSGTSPTSAALIGRAR
ncbi:MAG: hypothetical protein HZT43_18965 [Exiguobacterium profundum]|nr:MAG: hypothetical protein HZT43_18965 [Exiguobacterium profundum]